MSKLYFRYGAMNCGKTTNLLQVAHNYEERGMRVVIIKPKTDTKGADTVVSRLGIKRKVDYMYSKEDDIISIIRKDIVNHNKYLSCVLVDEVQFSSKEHIDQLLKIAISYNIPVICYGLRTDFQMKGFEGSERLLAIAHSLEELKTICGCGKKAIYNVRFVNNKAVFDGDQVVIDNNDKVEYRSVCGECYYKIKNHRERMDILNER